tara:strand:- start:3086 stop:3400 length:315 start_codon:yes stop_codon:yes gene_type:complete
MEHLNAFKIITTNEASDLINNNKVTLLDIRDEDSFSQGHIPNAINLSNNNIDDVINNSDKEDNILIYCYKGISSQNVAQHFCNLGYKNIFSLKGGFTEFSEKND